MIRTQRLSHAMKNRPTPARVATLVAATALLAATSVACSDDEPDAAPTTTVAAVEPVATTTTTLAPYEAPIGDIVGEALVAGQFTTLAALLLEAGLVDALRDAGPFTVFAPVDDAFTALPAATLDAVYADKDLLTAVLTYHVVAGQALNIADIESGTTLTTLQGTDLTITKEGDKTFVNGIEIVVSDVPATNGVIHVIGGVLVPNS
ncbi:MAG: fasciclin domain-containing protein [Actinomycetota bacterium]